MNKKYFFYLFSLVLLVANCGGDPSNQFNLSNNNPDGLPFEALTLEAFPQNPGLLNLTGFVGQWPLERNQSEFLISSPFGPREKFSENSRDDFHRGVDLPGELGEPVFTIASGKIYRVYPEGHPNVPEGGNTVVIEHDLNFPLSFHGETTTRVFSYYNHLDGFSDKAIEYLDNETQSNVVAGEEIGTLGQSGTTGFNHLHFEMRISTVCSLAFQIDNPQSSCAELGQDPHVNPVQFLLGKEFQAPLVTLEKSNHSILRATIQVLPIYLDFDFAALVLRNGQGEVVAENAYGLNGRVGIDASSIAALDEFQLDGLWVDPAPYTSDSERYELTLDFSNSTQENAVQADLLVMDVWGNYKIVSLAL